MDWSRLVLLILILSRETKKHMSSESLYPQWRMIKIFKVSGKNIEKMIHEFFKHYKVDFFNQKEIYKPDKNLSDFIEDIDDFLKENSELKLQNMQLKLDLLTNKTR